MDAAHEDSPPRRERLIEVAPGCRLNVIEEGAESAAAGSTLVFLHALGTDSSIWRSQREHFRATHRVVCIDAPGHGQSPSWPELTLRAFSAAVWRVADDLEIARLTFVGTSMGAVVALDAALQQPDRVDLAVLCGARLVRNDAQAHDLHCRSSSALHGDLEQVAQAMVDRGSRRPPRCRRLFANPSAPWCCAHRRRPMPPAPRP